MSATYLYNLLFALQIKILHKFRPKRLITTLIALYKEKNRTKYLCFRYGTTSHVTLPMLGPLMFDLFMKVYFIDRKLIATSEHHFDDNLNFMQNCFSRRRKTDHIFVTLPSTKLPLYLKKQRGVPLLRLVS